MKLLKPILTVFALAFALIFVTACSSGGSSDASSTKATAKARTIDEIKKSGELRIAVFGDKKPFGYVDNDGSYQGYDIELGNAQCCGLESGGRCAVVPTRALAPRGIRGVAARVR